MPIDSSTRTTARHAEVNALVAAAAPKHLGVPPRAVEPATFRAGMRQMAGTVCIIATGEPGRRAGLTATAVCSITAEPPRLLVCVNAKTGAHAPIAANGRLSVNVLSNASVALAERFAGMVPGVMGEARFAQGNWQMQAGVPVLEDACVAFACRVVETLLATTHSMFLCEVVDVRCPPRTADSPARESLLYFDGHYRHLAPITGTDSPLPEWIW